MVLHLSLNFKMPDLVDIDECQGTGHGCIQLCTNTVGSYMCGCRTGFQLHGDGQQCNGEFTTQIMKFIILGEELCVSSLIHRHQ